ncbi:hypothetical protein J2Y49_001100 [Azospirillum sp. BE72]|nr:hypothetical protein [Azospirillum sp. BE72]
MTNLPSRVAALEVLVEQLILERMRKRQRVALEIESLPWAAIGYPNYSGG